MKLFERIKFKKVISNQISFFNFPIVQYDVIKKTDWNIDVNDTILVASFEKTADIIQKLMSYNNSEVDGSHTNNEYHSFAINFITHYKHLSPVLKNLWHI